MRKQATIIYWRDYGDEKTNGLERYLQAKSGMLPTWEACRKAAEEAEPERPTGLADLRTHDLRHTFASIAVVTGESLFVTGKLLGHTQAQTTARYAHQADDPLRSAGQRIDAMLEETAAAK